MGSVTGRVVDDRGVPTEGASVSFVNWSLDIQRQARTDADGRFRFDDVHPAGYELLIFANNYFVEAGATVAPGAAVDLGDIVAPRYEDVTLSMPSAAGPVEVGDEFEVRMDLGVDDDDPRAYDAILDAVVPAGLEVVSVRRGWFAVPCAISDGGFSCTVPPTASFVIARFRAVTAGDHVVEVTATPAEVVDPYPANSTRTLTVSVSEEPLAPSDLGIVGYHQRTGDLDVVSATPWVTGSRSARDVVVEVAIPDGVEVVSARRGFWGAPCAIGADTVTCSFAELSTWTVVTVELRSTNGPEPVTFTATASADADPANNTATVQIQG